MDCGIDSGIFKVVKSIMIARPVISSVLLILQFMCFSCSNDSHMAGPARHTAVYVNARTGDDTNPGTRLKPLLTIDEACRRVLLNPSDIYLSGEDTFQGTLKVKEIGSISGEYMHIASYGRGKAVIDGGNNEAIHIEGCRNIKVENIKLKGNGRKWGNTSNGLSVVKSENIVISFIESEGFQKSGIDLFDCRNSVIRGSFAHDNGFSGINVMGSVRGRSSKIIIRACKAENNPGDPSRLDNHSGNGILVGMSDSVDVVCCIATKNGWDMPRRGNGPVGIWTWMSDHVKIEFCISYRNKTSPGAKDGGGFDLDGGVTNSLICYCISFGNHGAGYGLFQYPGAAEWSDNVVRNCISFNDARVTEGSGSIFIWNGSDEASQLRNCRICNNIVISSFGPAISFEHSSLHTDFSFSHNIFIGRGLLIGGKNSGSTFSGNIWLGRKGDDRLQGENIYTL